MTSKTQELKKTAELVKHDKEEIIQVLEKIKHKLELDIATIGEMPYETELDFSKEMLAMETKIINTAIEKLKNDELNIISTLGFIVRHMSSISLMSSTISENFIAAALPFTDEDTDRIEAVQKSAKASIEIVGVLSKHDLSHINRMRTLSAIHAAIEHSIFDKLDKGAEKMQKDIVSGEYKRLHDEVFSGKTPSSSNDEDVDETELMKKLYS